MSTATFTNQDLQKIVELALEISEGIRDEATIDDILHIVDGDEDIVMITNNLAQLRFLTWKTLEGGIKFLQVERELDREEYAKENPEETPNWID